MTLPNIYDGRAGEVAVGHIKGVWRDVGRQAGTRTLGVRRIEIAAEHFSTPAHVHGKDEEIFFVLAGDGLLWQDGETFAVEAGDCIVHRPGREAHTLRAGAPSGAHPGGRRQAGGLDVLVFGQRLDSRLTALPRAGVAWSFPRWVELGVGGSPFEREAACGPPECPPPSAERPANVVALADVEAIFDGHARRVGKAAGARATGLNHVVLDAGGAGAQPHCHSLEEEIFVVLKGGGVLQLWGRGTETPEEQPLGVGDVVSRVAGTGVAHSLLAGPDGLTYLAFGTRESADMCFYPRSGRVTLRGLGIALSSPRVEYLPEL
jgi:uncharacterized cupin superfamily protein